MDHRRTECFQYDQQQNATYDHVDCRNRILFQRKLLFGEQDHIGSQAKDQHQQGHDHRQADKKIIIQIAEHENTCQTADKIKPENCHITARKVNCQKQTYTARRHSRYTVAEHAKENKDRKKRPSRYRQHRKKNRSSQTSKIHNGKFDIFAFVAIDK